MSNANTKSRGNAGQPIPIYKIDIDRLIEGYTRNEAALQEIVNLPSNMTPQMQAYRMRAIAKKALGL